MCKKWLVLLAAFALFAMACDVSGLVGQFLPHADLAGIQATLAAVSTEAPQALASVVPATPAAGSTPAAPTKASATNAPAANASSPFADALSKAKGASKYRVQFSWVFGGMDKGKYSEQPFMDFSGEMDGAKSHLTSKGGILAMLAKDANTPIEIIEADGKTYMHGVSMFGLADPKSWYISSDNSTSNFADMAKPDEYKDWVTSMNAGDIKKVRSESLDGQTCDVYLYDLRVMQNQALSGLLGMAQDQSDFSVIDKGDMNFWLCKDGLVHQFVLDYEGHGAKDATQKAALKMTWHAWDFNNAAISVQAPKDAKPMPGK